jgi:hypothetical protein
VQAFVYTNVDSQIPNDAPIPRIESPGTNRGKLPEFARWRQIQRLTGPADLVIFVFIDNYSRATAAWNRNGFRIGRPHASFLATFRLSTTMRSILANRVSTFLAARRTIATQALPRYSIPATAMDGQRVIGDVDVALSCPV